MRVLVCGSRDFTERALMRTVLDEFVFAFPMPEVDVLIEGEAAGADTMAREWAEVAGIPVERYPADWDKYGRSAGPIRNREMLEKGKPDLVVAFVNKPLAASRGTANMVALAREAGVETLVIEHVLP